MIKLFQHLAPRALAWRTTVETTLRRYLEGLAGMPADVREFIDLVYLDLFPSTTRELATWEPQFALLATGSEDDRRNRLAAAWRATGGQSPDYIQQRLHDAGFTTVFVHEWWESGPPYVARDPRDYTTPPLVGTYQCEGSTPWECFDSGPGDPLAPHCDAFLANDPGYLVNLDLTRRAPPPVPSDPTRWPYFLYFAGPRFPHPALFDTARRDEFDQLLLSICPAQQWLVLRLTSVPEAGDLLLQLTLDGATYESGTEDDLRRVQSVPNPGSLGGTFAQSTSGARPHATSLPEGRAAYFNGARGLVSSIAQSSWARLHNGTGDVTIAIRLRLFANGGDQFILNTVGAIASEVGIIISFDDSADELVASFSNGTVQTLISGAFDPAETHTVVIVKDGADVSIYIDDMLAASDTGTIALPSPGQSEGPLVIGGSSTSPSGATCNGWIAEVLFYDFVASESQRVEIASYLERWVLAPNEDEYVAHMKNDGLAHFFAPSSIVDDATWTDRVTGEVMTLSGGTRIVATLDGMDALSISDAVGAFNDAAPLAAGTNNGFSVFAYLQIGPLFATTPIWDFFAAGPTSLHSWERGATTSFVRRSGIDSAGIGRDPDDRYYTHVFRAAADAANLVRVDADQNSPALNAATIAPTQFRITGGNGAIFAFVALYDRALNEGDLRALYDLVDRQAV